MVLGGDNSGYDCRMDRNVLRDSRAHKLVNLDALRGLAILPVIAAHLVLGFTDDRVAALLGNAGVILFFFLSGFLMDRTLTLDPDPVSYATRRAFRILPMYWLSLVLVAALSSDWTFGQVLANATFTAPVFKTERMLGVYWTLYIEVLFYCIAPLLVAAGDRAIRFSTYAVVTVFVVTSLFRDVGSGAPFYLVFCLCGMQVAAWYRGALPWHELAASTVAVALCSSLLLPVSIYLGLVPLCCAALMVVALRVETRVRLLELFGAVSYSWYLLHTLFGSDPPWLHLPRWESRVVIAIATLALSAVTYICLERPAIGAGKALVGAWRRGSVRVSA